MEERHVHPVNSGKSVIYTQWTMEERQMHPANNGRASYAPNEQRKSVICTQWTMRWKTGGVDGRRHRGGCEDGVGNQLWWRCTVQWIVPRNSDKIGNYEWWQILPHLSLCLCLSVCPSLFLCFCGWLGSKHQPTNSLCLSVCVSLSLSPFPLSLCVCVSLSLCPCLSLSLCLSVCLY